MQAQSADGVIHDFPAGTDISVIDRVMKSYVADAPKPAAVAAQPASDTTEMTPQQMYGGSAAGAAPVPQPLPLAAVNAAGQGLVGGVGSLVSGAGDIAKAGDVPWAQQVLKAFDLVDEGKNRDAYQKLSDAQRQQVGAYRGASPDDKAAQRASLQQSVDDYAKPNLAQQAGSAIDQASKSIFPVDPAQEGHVTGAARMVGGVGPFMAAGALGGPAGLLASAAAIGAQTFHAARADAIASGASDDDADAAAGKSALTQMAAMSVPISKVIPRIPLKLRDGFLQTLVNFGQNGVELGGGNTLGTIAQNYVAQQTYDPGRSVLKGTDDAGIDGFLAGLVIHGAGAAVGAARAPAGLADVAKAPAPGVGDVLKAPDIDSAIAAAGAAAKAPSGAAGAAPSLPLGWTVDDRFGAGGGPGAAGGGYGELFGSAPGDSAGPVPTLTLPSGQKVPARFDVAEGRDLIPASGDLQPRDRDGRLSSSTQITDIANKLDPELLHASPGPDQGAPTVNAGGVILAGNGRTRAIRLAYAQGNGAAYRAMVERYGFDTTGMSEPVLIRRIDQQMTPEQDRQIAVESNIPSGQRLSGTEQAAIDARTLSPDLLALYNPLLTGGPTAAGNRDFVRGWVGTLPQSERNAVQGSDGSLSSDGVRRLQGAMLSLAYGDKGTLSRSLESTDDNTKTLTSALTDAAPAWAQLQAEITAGRVPPEMNAAPQLTRAVELVRQARERGQSVGDVLSQSDAFNPIDPVTEGFVKAFFNPTLTRPASRPVVAEILRRYATEAAKTSSDGGLFGDSQPALEPSDILQTVVNSARTEVSAPREDVTAGAGADQPAAPDPAAAAAGEPVGDGDLWRLDPEQLGSMLSEKGLSDRQKTVRALGSEAAAVEFYRLDRKQNSSDPQRADEGAREFDAKFGNLTPEQERLIYGFVGDADGPQAEAIKEVLDAHNNRTDNPTDAGYEAASAIRRVPAAEIKAVPQGGASSAAQAAYVRLKNAYEDMTAAGVPADRVASTIAGALVERGGWSPGDAAEVVGGFVEAMRQPQPASAPSGDQPRLEAPRAAAAEVSQPASANAPAPDDGVAGLDEHDAAAAAAGWRRLAPGALRMIGQTVATNPATGRQYVQAPVAAPAPQSVGAASSSRDTTLAGAFVRSAREMKGQRADMELADLMRTPQPGDSRDIIPGASQTRSEIELSPSVSREAKGLRQEFREGYNEHEKANNDLFHEWLDKVTPSHELLGTMRDLREAQWKSDEKAVFGSNPNGAPVSSALILQHLQDVFADPVEKSNSYLRTAFAPFVSALSDATGNAAVMGAKELYGLRQEMGRKVKDMATNTDLAHVADQFRDLIKVTDATIMGGAPNYREMMDNYRAASIPINAGERLAEGRLKITNGSDRVITFGKFDAFMKGLWMERNGPNAYAKAKDIDPATWDHLLLLHERLARSASDQELARTRGSDTTQLAMELARKGAIGLAHGVVGHLTGGLGNVAIPLITKQIDQGRAARRVASHLNPDLSKYPTPLP